MAEFKVDETREMVDADRMLELLADLSPGTETVSLIGKSYGRDASERLADAFRDHAIHESVKVLNIADVIAGRPEAEAHASLSLISDAFESAPLLEHIDLSDNALGSKGIHASEKLIKGKKTLRYIYARNNGLNHEAMKLLTEMIVGDEKTTNLKVCRAIANDERVRFRNRDEAKGRACNGMKGRKEKLGTDLIYTYHAG